MCHLNPRVKKCCLFSRSSKKLISSICVNRCATQSSAFALPPNEPNLIISCRRSVCNKRPRVLDARSVPQKLKLVLGLIQKNVFSGWRNASESESAADTPPAVTLLKLHSFKTDREREQLISFLQRCELKGTLI
jgi:hypothetical protein